MHDLAGHDPAPLDLRRLYPAQNGEVAPPSGFAGDVSADISADHATLTYSGPDGKLEYQWSAPAAAGDPPLGAWRLRATPHGAKEPAIVPLAADARLEWAQTAAFKGCRLEASPGGAACVSTYEVNGQTATLRCTAQLIGKSLVLEVELRRAANRRLRRRALGAGAASTGRDRALLLRQGVLSRAGEPVRQHVSRLDEIVGLRSPKHTRRLWRPDGRQPRAAARARRVLCRLAGGGNPAQHPESALAVPRSPGGQDRARHLGRPFRRHRAQPGNAARLRAE